MSKKIPAVHVSPRGQITLPSEARRSAGIQPGDALSVTVHGDEITLRPIEILELERYSDARIEEFFQAAAMTGEETAKAHRKWGL